MEEKIVDWRNHYISKTYPVFVFKILSVKWLIFSVFFFTFQFGLINNNSSLLIFHIFTLSLLDERIHNDLFLVSMWNIFVILKQIAFKKRNYQELLDYYLLHFDMESFPRPPTRKIANKPSTYYFVKRVTPTPSWKYSKVIISFTKYT